MSKKYFLVTYGCQMNKNDSERIASLLEKNGYQSAPTITGADLVMINMCSVRQKAVDKARNQIFLIKSKNPKAQIVATGCVLENDKKWFGKMGVEIKKYKDMEKMKPLTGLVPIMQGCNNFCSYCVVPYVRGKEKCRPPKTIIQEIKHLLKNNIREITLLGQNVNSYPNFVGLLQKITALPGDFKIKFITNHPKDFSNELIKEMAQNPKIVKYVHLPLQSGDNTILKKMNRRYTRENYLKLINKIKKAMPDVELTTDIIVGFPDETKKQFQNTVDISKKVKFNNAFIAKYSERPGTAAAKLKDNVPLEEKKRREQVLRNLLVSQKNMEKNVRKLVVILGPTASGKSELGVKLAKKFNGEVVSADSRQVYKEMDIGTAKPLQAQNAKAQSQNYLVEGIPHYLIDIIKPNEEFNVAQYQSLAMKTIKDIQKRKKVPFLVGGSPFYIYSVIEGWQFPKMKTDKKLRLCLEKKSIKQLYALLKKLTPARAKAIEKKNKRRLIRAIEIATALGKVPALRKQAPFDCLVLGLKLSKEELKQRISARVEKMITAGLEKEVGALVKKYGWTPPLLQTIGYQEWLPHPQFTASRGLTYGGCKFGENGKKNGKNSEKEVAEKMNYPVHGGTRVSPSAFADRSRLRPTKVGQVLLSAPSPTTERRGIVAAEIKTHTLQFSKRQMTWFKRDRTIKWIENCQEAEKLVREFLKP